VAAGTPNLVGGPGSHTVLFYREAGELAGQVSAHLLKAIRAGGAAIVIATPAHRQAIAAALARAGAGVAADEVAADEAAGRYVALDAFETMNKLMVADWPNAASFWLTISPLIRPAAEARKPVCVFGEMVALLWDFGQVSAAIEVEAMWNELAAQYPFSLLCAYPADAVGDDQHQDALAEVCRVHAAVIGDPPGADASRAAAGR
jgi:MEDS: MEthanogen/methylotroph, DcmR Sensory domain